MRVLDLAPPRRSVTMPLAAPDGSREGDAPEAATRLALHPYLGWSAGPAPIAATLKEDDYLIGVFGGSVAWHAAVEAEKTLRPMIAARLGAPVSRLRMLNYAAAGYKQPQQLNALVQTLALGVPLDLVINIDGFNELALGVTDCARGEHPLLPSRSHYTTALAILGDQLPEGAQEDRDEIDALQRRAERLDAVAQRSPWRRSQLASTVLSTLAGRALVRAARLEESVQQEIGADPRMSRRVPNLDHPSLGRIGGCRELVASIWRRSSSLMAQLARSIGAEYVHVLQPNQYVAGSKPLSEEEREKAWQPRRRWPLQAAAGYPLLQREGRALAATGVGFHDLTGIFADESATIYIDPCCHMNKAGRRRLFREIIARIVGAPARGGRAAIPAQPR